MLGQFVIHMYFKKCSLAPILYHKQTQFQMDCRSKVKGNTIKLLEKKKEHPCDPGTGHCFINKTRTGPTINKEAEDKFGFKLRTRLHQKTPLRE